MKKLLIILALLSTIACNIANIPPFNQAKTIRVIYTYKVDRHGGVEFEFLAHKVIWVYDASQGPLPSLESVKEEKVLHPIKGMRFYIFAEDESLALKGKTDYSGHLNLVADSPLTNVTHDDFYACIVVNEWQTHRKDGTIESGGAVWQCNEEVSNP